MPGQSVPISRIRTLADLIATVREVVIDTKHPPEKWREINGDVFYPINAAEDIVTRLSEVQKRILIGEICDYRRAAEIGDAVFADSRTYGELLDLIIEEMVARELGAD